MKMEFESPDVERDFPGLYASESGKKSNESDYSDDDKVSKKELLIGKRKDKKDSKKDRGYATLEAESSAEEMDSDLKSPSKSKKPKSFKFPSAKKEKKDKKEVRETEKEEKKKEKRDKEAKVKTKLKDKKKSKHGDESSEADYSDERPIFGVPLSVTVERSGCHDGYELPAIVRECVDYIEEHGLSQEGIYRSSGVKSKVQQLKAAYDQRKSLCLDEFDSPVVASLLKQFLRELPEPVLTQELMPKFEETATLKDEKKQEEELAQLISELPSCNRLLLAWIFIHMGHVIDREKHNKMSLQNVAIVLSPTMHISHAVLNAIFLHSKTLFRGVALKKYVPPIGGAQGPEELPDCPLAIEEEICKQESLLNQIHREMNAGPVSKRREEQLWDAQRIVTQLNRKLRTARRQESSQKRDGRGDSAEDECKNDSITRTSRDGENDAVDGEKVAEEATATVPVTATRPEEPTTDTRPEEPTTDTRPEEPTTESSDRESAIPTSEEGGSTATLDDGTSLDGTKSEQDNEKPTIEERTCTPSAAECEGHSQSDTKEGPTDETSDGEDPIVVQLQEEELLLRLEREEILNANSILKKNLIAELARLSHIQEEMAELQANCSDSSEGSSDGEAAENDTENLVCRLEELNQENRELQDEKRATCQKLQEERMAVLHLHTCLRELQLKQDSKQV